MKTTKQIVRHVVLSLLAIFWLIPIAWLLLSSFGVDKGPNIRSFFPVPSQLTYYTAGEDIPVYPQANDTAEAIAIFPKDSMVATASLAYGKDDWLQVTDGKTQGYMHNGNNLAQLSYESKAAILEADARFLALEGERVYLSTKRGDIPIFAEPSESSQVLLRLNKDVLLGAVPTSALPPAPINEGDPADVWLHVSTGDTMGYTLQSGLLELSNEAMRAYLNQRGYYPSFSAFTLDHYRALLISSDTVAQFPRWFANTFTIAIFTCIISSLFVLMVAYAMSCMRFKARKPMMNLAIILNLFPGMLSMIAVYFVMKSLGMTNSNLGMIVVYSAGAGLGYLIAKGFFDTVSKSLREAAKLEGASEFTVFWKIIIPLSKPIIVYTIINSFLGPWMDFIFANIMLNSGISENKTVAIGLFSMVNKVNLPNYFAQFCAGGVLVSIPISVLFVIMQKFYVEGITGGSVKG